MKRILVVFMGVAIGLGLAIEQAVAQTKPGLLQGIDMERLQRLRPVMPFDRDAGYDLLDLWSLPDTTTHAPSASWKRMLTNAVIGQEIKLSPRWTLGLDGLIHIPAGSNAVDGQWLGYEGILSYSIASGHRIVLRSANNYTLRSHQWMTQNNLLYFYAPERAGQLVLSAGRTSGETIHLSNEELFAGQFVGRLGSNSPIYHYLRTYMAVRNHIYLTPRLRINALALYEHRRPQVDGFAQHRALVGEVGLYYDFARIAPRAARFATPIQTPNGYYAPELGLMYRAGVDLGGDVQRPFSRYQLLEGSLRSAYAWDDANKIYWGLTAGTFLERGRVMDADERYLPSDGAIGRTLLLGQWATHCYVPVGKHWLWGSVDYSARRLALTRWIGQDLLDEGIHVRGLWGASDKRWYEVGYSIGSGELLRLGVFAGSDLRGQMQWQIKLTAPILLLTSTASTRY